MSSTEAIKAGLRGKALRITHYYGDLLWEAAEGRFVPNAGFLGDAVFEDPAFLQNYQASDHCESDQHNVVENEEGDISLKLEAKPSSDPNDDHQEQVAADVGQLNITDAEEQPQMSIEDVDALLDKCLLQALHTTVKDKDLPMPGSMLW